MGNNAPTGYLKCDGTVYNIADYSDLATFFNTEFGSKNYFGGNGSTTFAVPNLQGEFLRGTGTNGYTKQGSGAAVGAHQNATIVPHLWVNQNSSLIGPSAGVAISETDYLYGTVKAFYNNHDGYTSGQYNNAYTTRPTNTSVWYLIKAVA